jgi:hypothetical protein
MRLHRNILAGAFLALGLVVSGAGCSRAQVMCDLICECEHCNDQEKVVACDAIQAEEDVADVYGCAEKWEALTVCVEEKGTCDEDQADWDTTDNDTGENRCDDEQDALNDCIDDASAHGGTGNF